MRSCTSTSGAGSSTCSGCGSAGTCWASSRSFCCTRCSCRPSRSPATARSCSGCAAAGTDGCPSGGGDAVVQRDRDEQVEQVADPPRVSPGALLDATQAVPGRVGVHLQALGGHPQVQVGVGEGPDSGGQHAAAGAVVIQEQEQPRVDQPARGIV